MCRRTGRATGSAASTASGSRTAISSHCVGMPSRLLVEQVSHLLSASVEANFCRRDRDTQFFGNRLMGEAVHVLEDHDGAQPGRELVERRRELGHEFGVLGGELWVERDLG